MLLFISLLLVCIIGFLAQSIGLCMVRGVNEWRRGKSEFLIAILFSGVLAWVAMFYASYEGIASQFRTYEANGWFALGGIVFGVGAAFNQGCGVSTLSKLARGDLTMLFTLLGWLVGWIILAKWDPMINHTKLFLPSAISLSLLIATSFGLFFWALLGDKQRRKLWFTMLSIGLISGFVFLFEPKWPPSGLLHKISHAMVSSNNNLWPTLASYLLFFALLSGMFIAAWHAKKFIWLTSNWQQAFLHLVAGIGMGIGASIALGGNDAQLLLALPTFSPGGVVAILAMMVGIWLGLVVKEKVFYGE